MKCSSPSAQSSHRDGPTQNQNVHHIFMPIGIIILKGTRILIPTSLQPAVLQQLHYAHQGAEKCQHRVKGSVFWANINRDIEEMVKCCAPCQRNQKLNVKETLVPHDIPPKPWYMLGSELFFLEQLALPAGIRLLQHVSIGEEIGQHAIRRNCCTFESHIWRAWNPKQTLPTFRNSATHMVSFMLRQVHTSNKLMASLKELFKL